MANLRFVKIIFDFPRFYAVNPPSVRSVSRSQGRGGGEGEWLLPSQLAPCFRGLRGFQENEKTRGKGRGTRRVQRTEFKDFGRQKRGYSNKYRYLVAPGSGN